jgi:hypothetical protein
LGKKETIRVDFLFALIIDKIHWFRPAMIFPVRGLCVYVTFDTMMAVFCQENVQDLNEVAFATILGAKKLT